MQIYHCNRIMNSPNNVRQVSNNIGQLPKSHMNIVDHIYECDKRCGWKELTVTHSCPKLSEFQPSSGHDSALQKKGNQHCRRVSSSALSS
jgi:hypothetical protein